MWNPFLSQRRGQLFEKGCSMFTQPEVAGWVRLWPLLGSLVSLLLHWLQKASALMNPIIVCAERMERALLRNREKLSNTQIPTDSSSIILVVSESLLIFHFDPKFNESGLAFSCCWPIINCWPLLQRDKIAGEECSSTKAPLGGQAGH